MDSKAVFYEAIKTDPCIAFDKWRFLIAKDIYCLLSLLCSPPFILCVLRLHTFWRKSFSLCLFIFLQRIHRKKHGLKEKSVLAFQIASLRCWLVELLVTIRCQVVLPLNVQLDVDELTLSDHGQLYNKAKRLYMYSHFLRLFGSPAARFLGYSYLMYF